MYSPEVVVFEVRVQLLLQLIDTSEERRAKDRLIELFQEYPLAEPGSGLFVISSPRLIIALPYRIIPPYGRIPVPLGSYTPV